MEIFKLFGSIFVNTSDAIASINKTTGEAEKSGSAFEKVGTIAKKLGGILAGAFTVKTIAGFVTQASDAASRVNDMAQSLGLSNKAFQEWDYILGLNGASIDSFSVGMKTLQNAMVDAANGSNAAVAKFEAVGLSLQDLANKSPEEAMELVIQKLQQMPEGAEKTAAALDLFGKQGQALMPVLNSTAQETENLKNKANELGLVMSDDMIKAGDDFGDALDTAKAAMGGIVNQIGAALMPALTEALEGFDPAPIAEFARGAAEFIGMFINVGMTAIDILIKMAPLITTAAMAFGAFKTVEFAIYAIDGFKLAMAGYSAIAKSAELGSKGAAAGVWLFEAAQKASTVTTKIASTATAAWSTVVALATGKITLAEVATAAWNAVLSVNPIVLATAAIVALGVAITGIVLSINEANSEFNNLKKENDELYESLKKSAQGYRESSLSINEQIHMSQGLLDKIKELDAVENKTTAQKQEMAAAVTALNETLGETVAQYDAQTDTLDANVDAIERRIVAILEEAKAEAYRERLTEIMKEQVKVEEQLAETERQLKKAQDAYNQDMEKGGQGSRQLGLRVRELQGEYDELSGTYEELGTKATDTAEKIGKFNTSSEQSMSNFAGKTKSALIDTVDNFEKAGEESTRVYVSALRGKESNLVSAIRDVGQGIVGTFKTITEKEMRRAGESDGKTYADGWNSGFSKSSINLGTPGVRKYATGTSFHPGGMALVGEQGPELVGLPKGSRVYTAQQTQGMMGGDGLGSGTFNLTLNVQQLEDIGTVDKFMNMLVQAKRQMVGARA